MASKTFSPFNGAHDFSINEANFTHVQGNYIVNSPKDKRRDFLEFHSRLSQNFGHEPVYAGRHEQNLSKTAKGTCKWVFGNPIVLEWRDRVRSSSPILWVHGPPGSGKSILCSQVIQDLRLAPTKPTLAYHFCDFSRQYKEVEILSMLACQLLEGIDTLGLAPSDAPQPLLSSITSAPPLQVRKPEYVRNVIEHLVAGTQSSVVYFLLDGVDEELGSPPRWGEGVGRVLHFLMKIAMEVPQVRLWVSSQKRMEIQTKLGAHSEIDLSPYARRDIKLFLLESVSQIQGPEKQDQDMFMDRLEEGAETSFIWATLMVDELKNRLSLSDMKDFIRDGFPSSLNKYYARIFDGYPRHLRPLASQVFSLVVYAKRPLRFCELWDALWSLSNKDRRVFNSDTKPYKDNLMKVFQPFIELIHVPGPGGSNKGDNGCESQHICRLTHSTVRDFFFSNRTIKLCPSPLNDDAVYICPEMPFSACLTYLSQSRFATLLKRQDDHWVDSNGAPVMEGRLLIYASKYWDKHLDDIVDPGRQKELLPLVIDFVKSPNFWTVIQVQSIWVQFQFSKLAVFSGGKALPSHLRRVFPLWFMHSEDGFNLWVQYRSFLRQWRYLLCMGEQADDFSDDGRACASFIGELHHIWTRALGHDHFLRERESTMANFSISAGGPSPQKQKRAVCIFFTDLVDHTGESVYTLRVSLTDLPIPDSADKPLTLEGVVEFGVLEGYIERWKLEDVSEPVLQKSQTIRLPANTFDLDLYITDPTNPYTRSNRAPLAAFGSDGLVLRIGSKIFKKNEAGSFLSVGDIHAHEVGRKMRYVEEIACRGPWLITASRTKLSNKDLDAGLKRLHEDLDNAGIVVVDSDDEVSPDLNEANGVILADEMANDEVNLVDSDDEAFTGPDPKPSVCLGSDNEERDCAVGSDSSDGSEAESTTEDDSVSENSSDPSDDAERFEDVLEYLTKGRQFAFESDSDSSESEDAPDTKKPAMPGNLNASATEDDDDDDDDWADLPRYFGDLPQCHSKPRAIITVWNVAGGPIRTFKREVPIRCKVHCSPPVFHPTQPLVVWPLGDGDILFVDYNLDKSFTLTLRPSQALVPTRFVSIQCVFSTCGQYIHIAALEGFRPDPELVSMAQQLGVPLPPLRIALLLATYRLSAKKTTRSPPSLIHVVCIDLKDVKGLDTKQLPFSFTWTQEYLYLTASWKMLQVWRVHLFGRENADAEDTQEPGDAENKSKEDTRPVLTPEKVVFLPNTCKQRSMRFFPAMMRDSDEGVLGEIGGTPSSAKVVVGYDASVLAVPTSKPRKELSSGTLQLLAIEVLPPTLSFEAPVVCYLDKKDLGEWVDSRAHPGMRKGFGAGRLYTKMDGAEMFNPEDDCDLEPYYF